VTSTGALGVVPVDADRSLRRSEPWVVGAGTESSKRSSAEHSGSVSRSKINNTRSGSECKRSNVWQRHTRSAHRRPETACSKQRTQARAYGCGFGSWRQGARGGWRRGACCGVGEGGGCAARRRAPVEMQLAMQAHGARAVPKGVAGPRCRCWWVVGGGGGSS
jgi:hypothetical protein